MGWRGCQRFHHFVSVEILPLLLKRQRSPLSARSRRWPGRRRRTAVHALQTSTITIYALASRLRASWMEARVTKVARVSATFSKSLARRRFRPEPGEGALDHPAARQDDEALHVVAPLDDLHAQQRHLCHRSVNLPRVVAAIGQINSSQGKRRRILSSTNPAPPRSWRGRPICGYVEAGLPAARSEFALIPPDNANFTKIVRRFTVRIRFSPRNATAALARPGMSVETASRSPQPTTPPRPNEAPGSAARSSVERHCRADVHQATGASWLGPCSSSGPLGTEIPMPPAH